MPEIAASDSRQGAWAWRELLYKAIDKGSQDSFVRYLAVECLHLLSAAGGATGGSIVGEQEKERLLQRLIPVADERERLRVQIVLGEEVRVKRIFNDMIRSNAEWAQKGLWGGTGGWILDDDLSGYTVNVGGVLLPRATMVTATGANSSASSGASAGGHHLVYTPTTVRNLRQMALAVSLRSPIQLVGLTGSGKSALIEELARMTGNELITIHLGDQTDSKVLLGTYVTTEKPGHFEWQPGVLTVAVKTGKWVAFEDIDLAPGEVVSVL
ncbi:AAA ATPase midasin, partial [Spiromyces aspiralis]